MLKLLRYTLAAIFLAASVGCLGLWWRSFDRRDVLLAPMPNQRPLLFLMSSQGSSSIQTVPRPRRMPVSQGWVYRSKQQAEKESRFQLGRFDAGRNSVRFPLWYPALVFALAAVGVVRLGKPFTIRSALIATTIVAARRVAGDDCGSLAAGVCRPGAAARMLGMGRFSLKRLLVATTLIAVGLGLLQLPATLLTIALGGPLIGAGILTPIRHPWIGALVGLVLTPFAAVAYTLWFWSVYGNPM